MATRLSKKQAQAAVDKVNECLREGFVVNANRGQASAVTEAARRLKMNPNTLGSRVRMAKTYYGIEPDLSLIREPEPDIDVREELRAGPELTKKVRKLLLTNPIKLADLVARSGGTIGQVLDAIGDLEKQGVRVHRIGDRYDIPKSVEAAYLSSGRLSLTSDENNRFVIGVLSDNHCSSKFERRDVLEDLFDRFAAAGVTHVLHAGNYLDGECRFNRFDLLAHGIEMQAQMLAETWPRRAGITTYAVTGDDHEGWYSQREGIDVGTYTETVMKRFERDDWVNLGYMEAHIPLINANTQAQSMASLVHPGGGSTYALSYAIQKIIESLEGGEKPAVGFYGHYHKLWAGNIRNVWCLCTGCTQDQTPFMRKNKIEAHVGGTIVTLEQDPESGAIIGFSPMMLRYFARGFYEHRWSHHGPVNQAERSVGGV